ncbi:NADPH-dependent FMN reductase [Pinibacter soli]|uniref:NAD(P)H-dependent oxidoreductase n=1 Tax=Pinibacter soli TaxID=3044211 RepID=A0ABT6RG86_9BACT|nr:NAD(P)H-dependent oxidoreductase [Pinibacter soli]MDI3321575.1 NAD(P)H-dependent oxidoreductase [Pinibacter soli]
MAVHFAGVSGSLRKGSYNTKLLKTVTTLLPEDTTMEILSIDLPLYNADLDVPAAAERPPAVVTFRNELAKADGLVIVSPEYNYSIPGGLKNAIDWASRGADAPLLNMPVSVMGATTGMWGTVRMQLAFHAVFQFLNMKPVYKPEVLIAQAPSKFNEHGEFTDESAKVLIRKQLENLKKLIINKE